MSRYGRLADGPNRRVTPEDLACWRDLVAAARAAATDPGAPAPALAKVVRAAKHACAPGVVTRDNGCIRLVKLARRFVDETAAGRRDLAHDLGAAAEAAEAALAAWAAAQPVRRERKDIEG